MRPLYSSLSLYWSHRIPLGLCSPLAAKIMRGSVSHPLALSSGDGPSPIRKKLDQSPKSRQDFPFDICSSVHKRNNKCITEQFTEEGEAANGEETVEFGNKHRVLGPGMVLLKHFLTHHVQADIVKTCRELGLHLQMMCLGRNWDPQTKYGENTDEIDSKPPDIPDTFSVLVEEAIREAHALIDRESGREDAEIILPAMSPDICIVNFYLETGRLGLHQDRDESRESIRDVEKAEQVKLESGDVLIFGGESRMIFHGVKSIIPNSPPKCLLNESKLRTGRLNLTFRHF
ncbi:hypothetical protein EUTSA_v10014289mg [Eutrema salsugineum]|uniref:Alpha-ketoglutarate-dependent dioxygenase AlkB-like domain-containing protein n=1 Tax=Eutrema salsugineum TaxID=72664 RepID=V4L8T0_EUTSA|nr:hypothetical protein EUTSA_v10014289mg [Eutrema salsugineum]